MLFLLFVLLLTLVIRGGTSSASMLLQQEEEKLASSARRQVTNTIIEEKDVSYTIQALVLKLDNEITHSNEKKNDYYMIDHLSLIKASIEEIAKRSTTRWRRRRDEEVDAEAALLSLMGTTTNPYSRHHGQILSFEECSPYNPNNGNVDDDPSTSSATTTCLKVKARLFRHGKQQQSPASVSEQFYFPCNNHQDDDATTTNGNDFVVVVNNNVDVWNLNTRRTISSIPVRMTVTNLSLSSSSSSFPNHRHDDNKKEQHNRNDSPQHKDEEESSSFQEGGSKDNGSIVTLMTRKLAAESWTITESTNNHEDEGNTYYDDIDNAHSTLSEQTTKTSSSSSSNDATGNSRMVLPPSTMNGLIVGVLAMIWLLVVICGCTIYSTRHHNDKYEVNDYFYHHNSHSRIMNDDDCLTEDELVRHHISSHIEKHKMKEQNINHCEDDDKECNISSNDSSSKEILSIIAPAAVDMESEGGVELVAYHHKKRRQKDYDNSTLNTEDYSPHRQNNVHNNDRRTSYTSASSFSTTSGSSNETKPTTIKTPWYAPPIQRQHWGETQVLPHLNWGDIFFDLFFVGAAYNLGVFLISLADDGNLKSWPRGIMYYIGMFGSLMLIWNKKTLFDSKYTVVDTLHRWSDMIRVCFLSISMMHIEPFEIMSNPIKANTFNFMLGLTLEQFVTLAIQWEVAVRGIGSKACHIEARHTMLIQQLPILMVYLVALGVSIYSHFIGPGSLYQHTTAEQLQGNDGRHLGAGSSSSGNNNETIVTEATINSSGSTMALNDLPYLILFCSYMTYQISLFLYTRCYLPSKKHRKRDIQAITTPVNVEFIIHRYGEWTMLMLGESVLSLLIVDTVELRDYYIVAAAGVIMVILLQVLHFESEPSSGHTDIDGEHHDDDEHPTTKQKQHALKRNKMSSLGFYYSTHLHSFALIALGASFKIMLQIVSYMFHNDASFSSPEAYHSSQRDSDGNTTTSNISSLFSHNNEEEQYTDNYNIIDQERTSSNNPYRFLRHSENISRQSSILSPWLLSSLSSLSSNLKNYILGSSYYEINHSNSERFLAGGTNASTQGIDDSNEVKVISANMFGISLALVLISMEFMSFSHCGFHQKKKYFQSLGILTKIAAFFIWLLRVELILAAATLSFYISEPKWLVFGGMIIVFLSVIVKSNGKDIVLYSHHI